MIDFKRKILNKVFDAAVDALQHGCTEAELEEEIAEAVISEMVAAKKEASK